MAHYVFQRNNGYGDFDYIRSFQTMEITDYPQEAAQVDDRYLGYIDIPYMNSLGFYAVGITQLALRIIPMLLFQPVVRGYRPVGVPRPPRAHIPGVVPAVVRPPRAPRPHVVAPRAPKPHVVAPRAPRAPRPAGPVGVGPKRGPGGRGPGGIGGPGRGMGF